MLKRKEHKINKRPTYKDTHEFVLKVSKMFGQIFEQQKQQDELNLAMAKACQTLGKEVKIIKNFKRKNKKTRAQ